MYVKFQPVIGRNCADSAGFYVCNEVVADLAIKSRCVLHMCNNGRGIFKSKMFNFYCSDLTITITTKRGVFIANDGLSCCLKRATAL